MSGATLLVLLAAAAPSAAPATSAPAAGAAAAPAPPPPARAPAQPPVQTPFRLSLTYTRVLAQDGELTNDALKTNAVGIDMAFPSGSYVRNHLGLAHQWESAPGYSARGFRIDLVSLGYPIELMRGEVRLDLEPVLTLVRMEILWPEGLPSIYRFNSGFGLDLSVTYRRWFLSVEPQIDFRTVVYSSSQTLTGFGRLFPIRFALGHEF